MIQKTRELIRKNCNFTPNFTAYSLGTIVLGAILIYQNLYWIPVVQIVLIISCKIGYGGYKKRLQRTADYMDTMVQNVAISNHHIITYMHVGLAVFDPKGSLQWWNQEFHTLTGKEEISGKPIENLLPLPEGIFQILTAKEETHRLLTIGPKIYTMESKRLNKPFLRPSENTEPLEGVAIYLYDHTEYSDLQHKYDDEKLALCSVRFDNYDEVARTLPDSGLIALNGATTGMLTKWVNRYNGFIVTQNNVFSLVGLSQAELRKAIANKFEILDNVHNINTGSRINPTFSIGIAVNRETLNELSDKSQSALDLALNRGGDQVVIDDNGHLNYYGATGTVTAKATRVKVRIVAHALRNQIESADNVIIMGHTKEDFDSIGASVGIACMVKHLNKPVNIVIGTLAGEIVRSRQAWHHENIENPYEIVTLIGAENAKKVIGSNTLLILVDHHRQQLSSIPELVDLIPNRIIIDHHRRGEDIIPDLSLLYQEPSSSSTSEMVTELFTYFDDDLEISKLEATSLYNGILLDTKKFTVQTGERTFEAAAYLRHCGANLKIADELFANSLEDLRSRSLLLSRVRKITDNFVVAVQRLPEADPRTLVLAAQTADELVHSIGIHGACIITESKKDGCSLSARSDGSIYNVQTMMEAMGGGGHQMAAACQLPGKTAEEAEAMLIAEIKKQLEEKK